MSLDSRQVAACDAQDEDLKGSLRELIFKREKGRCIECLDDGFVSLVDHMGDDSSIVQAARVSYGAGTKTHSTDRALIRYLMRQYHTSPFEQCQVKFLLRMPILVARQHIRHRTFALNEYSGRYSVLIDSMLETPANGWRSQSTTNKQGSGQFLETEIGERLTAREQRVQRELRDFYQDCLDSGVAREQARNSMPVSNYTEMYWCGSLHNIFHYLRLRMDSHAQYEIRQYADAMFKIINPLFPIACEAFVDYRLNAMSLSGLDVEAIKTGDTSALSKRELQELETKRERLGL